MELTCYITREEEITVETAYPELVTLAKKHKIELPPKREEDQDDEKYRDALFSWISENDLIMSELCDNGDINEQSFTLDACEQIG